MTNLNDYLSGKKPLSPSAIDKVPKPVLCSSISDIQRHWMSLTRSRRRLMRQYSDFFFIMPWRIFIVRFLDKVVDREDINSDYTKSGTYIRNNS